MIRLFEKLRLERERKTVAAMIAVFCRGNHAAAEAPCPECAELEAYASLRLEKCPYGETKPTCANCPIHCYEPRRREQVRRVMAYAGPRMLFRRPILALRHMRDGRRKAPPLARARRERQREGVILDHEKPLFLPRDQNRER